MRNSVQFLYCVLYAISHKTELAHNIVNRILKFESQNFTIFLIFLRFFGEINLNPKSRDLGFRLKHGKYAIFPFFMQILRFAVCELIPF
jgi:hypothetical protein